MSSAFEEFQQVLARVPHVKRAQIYHGADGVPRVQVVSESSESPRHIVREIVALLRSSGWHNLGPEQVVVVKIQSEELGTQRAGRLRITGYGTGRLAEGYRAHCRLSYGDDDFEAESTSVNPSLALAEATLKAVSRAMGEEGLLRLHDVSSVATRGVEVILAVIQDLAGEYLAGNAMVRESAELAVVRATLDAVNRRFVMYTGQKV